MGSQPPERSDQQISAAQEACVRALRELGELRSSIEVIKVGWSEYIDHTLKVALTFTTIVREKGRDAKFEIFLELRDGEISVNKGMFSRADYSLVDPESLSNQLVKAIKLGLAKHIASVQTWVIDLENMLHQIPT
jgi:hypothetical protein